MTYHQDAISIPTVYLEAFSLMLGSFLIGYIGCYLYYRKVLKKERLQSLEESQSLKSLIDALKVELEQSESESSYQKDRMDQDYEQVQFKRRAFSEKIIQKNIASSAQINFDIIGYASEDIKDNLQEIKGIGPYTEAKLNKLGIYTYEQISKFTEEDIETVTELIKFFPDRIKNDQWIVKARNLLCENEKSKKASEEDTDLKKKMTHKKATR